jgi:hypothetical protein
MGHEEDNKNVRQVASMWERSSLAVHEDIATSVVSG